LPLNALIRVVTEILGGGNMNYTFFAIACYIVLRAFQVLFEEKSKKKWYRNSVKVIALITLYSGFASLLVWYLEIHLLGFCSK
jgi:hypothetical protein